MDPKLVGVLVFSVALHLIIGLVLGGITVVEYIIVDDANFEAPDDVIEEEPPPEVEVKIEVPPPKMETPAYAMKNVANITVNNINVDLPSMGDSFTVSSGLGSVGSGGLSFGKFRGTDVSKIPDIDGFGTTQEMVHAWKGTVYLFKPKAIKQLLDADGQKIVGLKAGRRQGNKIYNYVLNLPVQDFSDGFPGVTKQFEWFAIEFEADIYWPSELAGEYEFRVKSDDGAVLLIDGDVVVNNDGQHGMEEQTGKILLEKGVREFRLVYYQGPATELGLVLEYRKVGSGGWKLFDLKELIKYQTG